MEKLSMLFKLIDAFVLIFDILFKQEVCFLTKANSSLQFQQYGQLAQPVQAG